MIGLFDSGLGGLTVVRRVREALPQSDLVFFADRAHVPYGDRSPENLRDLLELNLRWLDDQGVEAVAMACNTSCAIAERYGWPPTRAVILDLIDAAAAAVERSRARRVGVVATAATVRTGSYGRRLRDRIEGIEVFEVPAPALVPLVESGAIDGDEARAAVADAVEQLPRNVDAVVYGCTHYPVLEAQFARALGNGIALIDPAFVQAERAAVVLAERGHTGGSGQTRMVTSGDPGSFEAAVRLVAPALATTASFTGVTLQMF